MLSWPSRSEAAAQKLTPKAMQFVEALDIWLKARPGMPIYSSDYHKFFVEQKLNAVVTEESVFTDLLNAIPIVGARQTICKYIILNRPEIITNKETLSHIGTELGFSDGSKAWWGSEPFITSWMPETTIKQFEDIYSKVASVLTSSSASMFSASNQEKKTNTLHENNRPT